MLIADTNEFHPLVNAFRYKSSKEPDGTNHPIVIMRATYSSGHVDHAYRTSLDNARAAGLTVGHYGYMVANVDASLQGRFFAHTVLAQGKIRAGDSFWCDDEEGAGNQTPRALSFLDAAHAILKDNRRDEGVYSGAAFWNAHLSTMPDKFNRWIAAYGQADPKILSEDMWQFTDKMIVPGVAGPADVSVFHGTLKDFLRMVGLPRQSTHTNQLHLEKEMQYLVTGSKAVVSWPDDAQCIRFVTNSDSPVPFHIDWFVGQQQPGRTVVYGNVNEVPIPDGRGAVIHRDDKAGDPSDGAQFGFVFTT